MTIVYPLKLDEEIVPILELKSKDEHTNKAVVLKQLIYHSLEDYVLQLCSKGRISVGKAARVLGLSIYDIQDRAQEKGIKLTASKEQLEYSKKVLERLSKATAN